MTRLLFIRHAPTATTGRVLTGRLPGHPLTEQGRSLAAALGERLSELTLAAVYCSPLERTFQTAQAVATHHRATPTRHLGLVEIDYGRWAGRSLASLRRLAAWRTVMSAPSRMTFPDGESMLSAQHRVVTTCEEIARRHDRTTVAVVSHADPIRMALSHYLGQSLDLYHRLGCSPASVSVVDLSKSSPPRVIAVNTNGDPSSWR